MPSEREVERMRNMLTHIGQLLITNAQLFGVGHIDVFCKVDEDHTYFCASVFEEGWEDAQVSMFSDFEREEDE